tara:strand:- start:1464 stop:2270 length:807 start_codon:yes stop_codon:yes gene_type:complete
MPEVSKISSVAIGSIGKIYGVAKSSMGKFMGISAPAAEWSDTKSLAFDGTNDIVVMAEQTYDLGSWSVWMKTSDQLHVCFSAGNWYYFYSIYGFLRFAYRESYDNITSRDDRIDDGNWHHFVITLEREGELGVAPCVKNVYIDGSLHVTLTEEEPRTYDLDNDGNQVLKFGDSLNGWQPLAGNIDEVGYWAEHILTEEEATALYNSGAPIDLQTDSGNYASSDNLTSYWRFGDGDTYPTITDNEGSNHGTMTNMSSGDIVEDVPSGGD